MVNSFFFPAASNSLLPSAYKQERKIPQKNFTSLKLSTAIFPTIYNTGQFEKKVETIR